jgi:MFS family permease
MMKTSRLTALQHRDFRLFWAGQTVSVMGSQMQLVAVDWHVYQLLRGQDFTLALGGWHINLGASALGLGGLGLARILPIIAFALLGGIMADLRDRHQLMMLAEVAAAVFALGLAVVTFTGCDNILAIYLLTAAGAATTAFENPARQSLVPNLVPREDLSNAVSLNTLSWQLATIFGPMMAGVLLSRFDASIVYSVNAGSFLLIAGALLLMRYRGKAAATNTGVGWETLLEGFRFTYNNRIIWGTMLLDFLATFFSSARTMLPIVASDVLGVGVQGYALLVTAQPLGALLAGIVLSLRKEIVQQGKLLLACVALYGLATAFFGLSVWFWLSYLLFAITGAADTVSTVIRGTLRQVLTPDHLRGRMMGVNMMFFMGGPQLGELEAGLVASVGGVGLAIVSGGLATLLLTGWIAWKYPRLRRYTAS